MSSSGFLGSGIGPTAIKRHSGLAAPVPVAGAELLSNGGFEIAGGGGGDIWANWTEDLGNGALVDEVELVYAGSHAARTANGVNAGDYAQVIAQITTIGSTWYLLSVYAAGDGGGSGGRIYLYDNTNGVFLVNARQTGISNTIYTAIPLTIRVPANTASLWMMLRSPGVGVSNYCLWDNATAKPIITASLFSTRAYASADCDLSVGVARTAGTQAGLVARLDSATSPANFIIAYLDGAGNVKVDKCVAGTYTNIISGAVTYGSTKILRLVCSGNSVSAYYDGTQVGSTVTVSDAGIVSNVLHGKFSTYASNTFGGYVAA